MDKELTRSASSARLKRSLAQDAIDLALKGEWERATEVNRAILELFADDVEAMNRLGKAYMELGKYDDARGILGHVARIAPYNNIAKRKTRRDPDHEKGGESSDLSPTQTLQPPAPGVPEHGHFPLISP